MLTNELLDAAQSFWDNVSDIDAGFGQRRVRLLLYAQQAYDEIRNEEEWQWEYASIEDGLSAGAGVIDFPADYEELGVNGGLFISNNLFAVDGEFIELTEEPVSTVSKLLRQASVDQVPRIFSIYGNQFVLFPKNGSDILYKIVYSKAPLTLTDTAQDLILPARYHHTVLLPALVSRMQEAKGDVREGWTSRYKEGLKLMKKRERPRKTVTQQMPSAVPEEMY